MAIDFPVKPRTGRELKKLFEALSPFNKYGGIRPQTEQVTLLAANSNYPNELQTSAFVQAAGESDSPIIVQYSYTSTSTEGGDPKKARIPKRYTDIRPTAIGAQAARDMLERHCSLNNADLVFMALDHFTAPEFNDKTQYEKDSGARAVQVFSARDCLTRVLSEFGVPLPQEEELQKYADYMASPEYQAYRADFLAAVEHGKPAWAMIDTGNLPLVLNFATSRDLVCGVRNELENLDVMIEAELSATGQSSGDSEYKYWTDLSEAERGLERETLAAFFRHVEPEAIAYEFGNKHAAKGGESHKPDYDRIIDLQPLLYHLAGGNVPLAQHGGSGSSMLIKGLVGKNNVNTQFLHAVAMAELEWAKLHEYEIRAREKRAISSERYFKAISRVKEAATECLKLAGSYGIGERCRQILGTPKQNLPVYSGLEIKSTE